MARTTTHRIAEVARRSGFSTATLRYYETIGLLRPADRSVNGYRTYDDTVLDRLAFIARAKQLGCSLDEIAELSTAWDGGSCAGVQERLAAAAAAKIDDAFRRIDDLRTFVADLQSAITTLAAHTPDGPCDDRCGCTSAAPVATPAAAAPARIPVAAVVDEAAATGAVPVACTLGSTDLDRRLEDWRDLLTQVVERLPVDRGLRLTFHSAVPADRIARLAAAEQDCCRFFTFALTVDDRGVALEVRAPDTQAAQSTLMALFGSTSRGA